MTNSYAGLVKLKDASGNYWKVESNASLSVVSFTANNWTSSGSTYTLSLTGCSHVIDVYKIVNSNRVKVPMVSVEKTGTRAFTLQSITAFAGEVLIA